MTDAEILVKFISGLVANSTVCSKIMEEWENEQWKNFPDFPTYHTTQICGIAGKLLENFKLLLEKKII